MFGRKKNNLPQRNYHYPDSRYEVDSWREGKSFDEASYYEGDRFELGGVDFGMDQENARFHQEPFDGPRERYDYWDEGVGVDYSRQGPPPHQHGWDRPGRRSSNVGTSSSRAGRYEAHEPWSLPDDRPRGQHSGKGPKGYNRDERLQEKVCHVLFENADVDASHIEVEVRQGEVTLKGNVESRRMKKLAERCVERVHGVEDVRNHLSIHVTENKESLPQDQVSDLDRFKMA